LDIERLCVDVGQQHFAVRFNLDDLGVSVITARQGGWFGWLNVNDSLRSAVFGSRSAFDLFENHFVGFVKHQLRQRFAFKSARYNASRIADSATGSAALPSSANNKPLQQHICGLM
jgi:hypothetical protein